MNTKMCVYHVPSKEHRDVLGRVHVKIAEIAFMVERACYMGPFIIYWETVTLEVFFRSVSGSEIGRPNIYY